MPIYTISMNSHTADFRFYGGLNDFIEPARRGQTTPCPIQEKQSVKDAIESMGVPHTEVDLILADDQAVDFTFHLRDGCRIAVYPHFYKPDIAPEGRLHRVPDGPVRFVLDGHLGKLARWLRLIGYDSLHMNHCDDADLAGISAEQERVLLTRDRGLLMRRCVVHGCYVRETESVAQLREVMRRYDLNTTGALTRCMVCNGMINPVGKSAILDLLPENTRKHYTVFFKCGGCGKIFWEGSHHARLRRLIESL